MAGARTEGCLRDHVLRLLRGLPGPNGAGRGACGTGNQGGGGAASGAGRQGVGVSERVARELARAGPDAGQADGRLSLIHI
eukprot:9479433-Pyramimonas_sp.AAC.1